MRFLPTEASSNNTPLIAFENLSSLFSTLQKQHTQTAVETYSATNSTGKLQGPSGVIILNHAYILSYITVLFTIMHPMIGSSFVLQCFP